MYIFIFIFIYLHVYIIHVYIYLCIYMCRPIHAKSHKFEPQPLKFFFQLVAFDTGFRNWKSLPQKSALAANLDCSKVQKEKMQFTLNMVTFNNLYVSQFATDFSHFYFI